MSSIDEKFRRVRQDQSPYLFHFMRGTPRKAKETLYTILKEERLISSNGYICFTASPITALMDFFNTTKSTDGLPMYQPFGIGFSRDRLIRDYGARNVIYSNEEELKALPAELKWRSLLLEVGQYDFEYLREWRIPSGEFSFSGFPRQDMLILAPTKQDLNDLIVFHDVEFTPFFNEMTGELEVDSEEVFVRSFKGMTIKEAAEQKNDYAVSGATMSQKIGEDMLDNLFESHFYWTGGTKSV